MKEHRKETMELLAKAQRRVARLKARGWKKADFARALGRLLGIKREGR